MNVLVLNGSPKGNNSTTLYTVKYIEKLFPQCNFRTLHVGQRIRAIENDFSPAAEEIAWADVLLFSYPVYTFIAPYQLHRFIELMKEHGVCVEGKYATQITTSKHFYDVTAHRYIQDNCADLGLRYVTGLSADMDDLLHTKGQQDAKAFWEHFCWCVEKGYEEPLRRMDISEKRCAVTVPHAENMEKSGDVVIVADLREEDVQLAAMIERFRAKIPYHSRVVNLQEYPFSGGCLGCFNCAVDGKCIYKDGFDEFLRNQIQTGQAIIYAFTISDHSMGTRFKLYDDRQFCNGHRTVTMGMPMGYLISGNYCAETNLQMIVDARAQVGGNTLVGVATDETDPDREIDQLADALSYALENRYLQPQNFYGVGGMKIFRDLIYQMRGMMKADHRFYKEHGQYDFPQKQKGRILFMYFVGAMLASPKMKAKMGNKMTDGMVAPYRKVLEQVHKSDQKEEEHA